MDYDILLRASKKANVSLSKFYTEANISFKVQSEMKDMDFVPSYIRLMLMSFIEKELKIRDSDFFDRKKSFFVKAKGLGYKEDNGFIIVSLFSSANDIKISDFESQFIKFIS